MFFVSNTKLWFMVWSFCIKIHTFGKLLFGVDGKPAASHAVIKGRLMYRYEMLKAETSKLVGIGQAGIRTDSHFNPIVPIKD